MNPILATLILASFVINTSFAQGKTGNVKVDTSFTGFTFAADFSGTKIYTRNGKADFASPKKPSAFSVTVGLNATYEIALKQFDMLMNMSKHDGYAQTDVMKKDTVINGNKGYYVSFIETLKGTDYKNINFYAFYIKDNTALIFTSGDLDNGKYTEAFKKTFYAIKL